MGITCIYIVPCCVAGDQSSGKGSGHLKSTSSPLHVDPAVVVGCKAVEAAYQEGKYPVVDKTVDVYALLSSPGKCSNGYVCFSSNVNFFINTKYGYILCRF